MKKKKKERKRKNTSRVNFTQRIQGPPRKDENSPNHKLVQKLLKARGTMFRQKGKKGNEKKRKKTNVTKNQYSRVYDELRYKVVDGDQSYRCGPIRVVWLICNWTESRTIEQSESAHKMPEIATWHWWTWSKNILCRFADHVIQFCLLYP